jgi:xylulokinase
MFLDPSAYLTYRLTGEYFTNVWDNFRSYGDPHTGKLPRPLLDALGIDARKFPEVYPIGSKTFPIRPDLATEFGLSPQTQIVVATNDSGLAVIGSGISKPGDTNESCGSASVLKVLTPRMLSDPQERVYPQPAIVKNHWYVSGYEMAGAVFEWYKKQAYGLDKEGYSQMDHDVQNILPGAKGVVFIPYLFGAKCPNYDPKARAYFLGVTENTTRADKTCAVFESMGYITRDIIETFEAIGAPVKDIYISGGLTKSDVLTQMKTDITGRRIHVLAERETTSLGAAVVAATALGVYPSIEAASKAMIHVKRTFEPNPENTRTYDQLFVKWKHISHAKK